MMLRLLALDVRVLSLTVIDNAGLTYISRRSKGVAFVYFCRDFNHTGGSCCGEAFKRLAAFLSRN